MRKYQVTITYTKVETWEVEASSPEEAAQTYDESGEKVSEEKHVEVGIIMDRLTVLLGLNVAITTLFYVLVDAPLCLWLISEKVPLEPWWFYIPIIVGMISFGMASSFLLVRDPVRYRSIFVLAIMVSPFIMIWSGLMDIASMTAQYIYNGDPPFGWFEVEWLRDCGWFWLEPRCTYGIPFLPYLISRINQNKIITTPDVIASSVVGALIITIIIGYQRKVSSKEMAK